MRLSLRFFWLVLLALTLLGVALSQRQPDGLMAAVVLLTLLKGHWLIDRFMGLATGPLWLRATMSGWLLLVLSAMALL